MVGGNEQYLNEGIIQLFLRLSGILNFFISAFIRFVKLSEGSVAMSLPHRSLPPGPPPPYSQPLPPSPEPPAKRTIGSYFSLALWRTLLQQAARHRYWMKGAAIAYGTTLSLLLGFLALLSLSALKPAIQASLLSGMALGFADWVSPLTILTNEIATEWSLFHRWLLLLVSTLIGIGSWLKVTGLTQQIIRSDGDLASHLVPTLRHRLITLLMAAVSAALTMLAVGLMLMTVSSGTVAIAPRSLMEWGQHLLIHALRWCLAISTIALAFGLLYRSSQKAAAKAMPILPGTGLAALLWLVTWIVLKGHLASLSDQHWLWQITSTLALALLGLYVSTLGLLLGGQYNKLINRHYPNGARSRRTGPRPPAPSFESFTIPKRPYR